MDFQLIIDNLSNPALLFFFLGILAVLIKSDLAIPESSSKFISLYLLLAIGFKGGQELSHTVISGEIISAVIIGFVSAMVVPIYTFYILKNKYGVQNAGAIAASYGSVSAVTFITTVSYLESRQINFGGHMIAVMAIMEAPAIIVGVFLISLYEKNKLPKISLSKSIKHALTNGSVLLIIGSLIIGYIATEKQAEGIKPFTTDLFKGFLAVFLLDMGVSSGKKLGDFFKYGWSSFAFSILIPLFNGSLMAIISSFFLSSVGNRLLLSILVASASYIAVPAAMKLAAPKANSGLYVSMALAITFPLNITLGMPIYLLIINMC